MTYNHIKNVLFGALLAGGASTGALAQTQPLETNWAVVGWFSNKPIGTLKPSGGWVPYPQDADKVPPEYDTRLILPDAITFTGLTPPTGPSVPTLLYFSGLPNPSPVPSGSYLAYPFKTGPQNDADILINQATYSLDSGSYGQDFNITATLFDVDAQQEYPLSTNVTYSEVPDPNYQGFQFINNQQWPMSPSTPHFSTNKYYKFPVPLKPSHKYELRTYLAKNSPASDGLGMMDDMVIYMQAVVAEANDDPNVDLPAATGGSTPTSVVANDKLLNVLVNPAASNYVVTPVGTLPAGVIMSPNGIIQVAPAQPQTYTIPYQLCPNYGTTLFGAAFQSNACKTATATVTLIGAPPPPAVSVACTPPSLNDSPNEAAICTIKADTVVTNPLVVNLQNLAATNRFSGSCTGVTSVTIPGGTDNITCTIVATANTIPQDGNVTATLSLVDNPVLYTVAVRTASVAINDDDMPVVPQASGATPVPTLQAFGLMLLSMLFAALGVTWLRRTKA